MDIEKILNNKWISRFFEHGEKTVDKKEFLRRIASGIGYAALTFLFGLAPAPFSCYPFGIAFLSAVDKNILYCLGGAMISALFCRGMAPALMLSYILCLSARYAASRFLPEGKCALFGEPPLIRSAVALGTAFLFGLYRLIAGGFLYYDLFGLLLGFLVCPLITFLLYGLFSAERRARKFYSLSLTVLLFITVYSLRGMTLFGFSPAFTLAAFVTLWAAVDLGGLRGCAVGLVVGIACGIDLSGFVAPLVLAAFGLLCGLLWEISKTLALSSSLAAGLILGLITGGFSSLPMLLPDLTGAVIVFLPLSLYRILPKLSAVTKERPTRTESVAGEAAILEERHKESLSRMKAISESFSELSRVVYQLSDRFRKPEVSDLKEICSETFDKICEDCISLRYCWEKNRLSMLDAESGLAAALAEKEKIEPEDFSDELLERCHRIDKLTEQMNRRYAALSAALLKNDRTAGYAFHYEMMAKLCNEAITVGESEYVSDPTVAKAVSEALAAHGIPAAGVLVFGKRKRQIVIGGMELASAHFGADDLRHILEEATGFFLARPKFAIGGESVSVTVSERCRFSTESASATNIKENEPANGDAVALFRGREELSYALISDGMGSGKDAAITSRICLLFIQKMLSGGNSKALTLEMLNEFLRSRRNLRSGECSATVDLAEIDLLTGKVLFVKSGAAPSFILRCGNLYQLQSRTAPLGILPNVDAEQLRFDLKLGDVLILLSDGVAASLDDGAWLANLITYEWEDDLQKMAEKILDQAAFNHPRSDDMSAALVRIVAAPKD